MILYSWVLISVLASVILSSNPLPFIILKYTEIFLPDEALKILRMQIFLIHFFHWKSFDKKGSRLQINVSRLQVTAIPIEVLNRVTPFHETWLNILTI